MRAGGGRTGRRIITFTRSAEAGDKRVGYVHVCKDMLELHASLVQHEAVAQLRKRRKRFRSQAHKLLSHQLDFAGLQMRMSEYTSSDSQIVEHDGQTKYIYKKHT